MNKIDIEELRKEIEADLLGVKDLDSLDHLHKKYLDKKGKISLIFQSFSQLSTEEKTKIGNEINKLKKALTEALEAKTKEFKKEGGCSKEQAEWIDITLPGKKPEIGHIHPITQSINRVKEIFEGLGFSIAEGPELEDEWHNFDALNFPDDHPAREMQDTLFVKQSDREKLSSKERFLMRTHTSPVQIRYMQKKEPPFRIFVPGRVFRNEATDASHEVNFYQVEALMVDKNISVANYKAVVNEFCKAFYGKEVKIRLRPSFFPFTEPSFEVDMSCTTCNGKGCPVCSQTGWLEIMGAGMVHPNVLRSSGVDPKKWQGFAFGFGWDRIVMMKHKIDDVRLFYGGDLRFLKQF